jgi:hypothetical protein
MGRKKNKKGGKQATPLSKFLDATQSPPTNAWVKPLNITSDTPAAKPAAKPAPGMTISDIYRDYWSTSKVTASDLKAFVKDTGVDKKWILSLMEENPCLTQCSKQDVAQVFLGQIGGKLTNCVHSGKMTGKGALEMAILGPHCG